MNFTILNQYNLEMRKGEKKFEAYISGDAIANYITGYRHPDDIDAFVSDVNLAISGNYNQIEDPEHSGGIGGIENFWHAWITPIHFELWQDGYEKTIIPLEDWKEILLSWKECVEG